jgi:putative sterol carrier protein
MATVIEQAVEALRERLAGGFDGAALFVIEDEGAILVDGEGVRAGEGPADVTLRASAETFRGLLDGSVNPTSAFMQGRLSVDGDMGAAMRLAARLG